MMPSSGPASRLLVIAVVIATVLITPSVSAAFKYISEGMESPELTGTDLRTGEQVSIEKYRSAGMVVVVFWATWSPRSLEEVRDLNALAARLESDSLYIVAVNVDGQKLTPTRRKTIESIVQDIDPAFPVILDDGLEIFYRFGVIAVPSTAVIDPAGVLRYAPSGYSLSVRDYMVDSIESFLGLREPADTVLMPDRYQPDKTASRYYRLALKLYHLGMYEQATRNLELARQEDSLFASVPNLQGVILLQLDQPEAALEEFRTAVTLDSSSVSSWAGMGKALLVSGAYAEATEVLEAALAIEDTYTPALLDYAICLGETGNAAGAIDSLSRAADLNANDFMIYYYLGRIYRMAEQVGKAAEAYEKALSLLFPRN